MCIRDSDKGFGNIVRHIDHPSLLFCQVKILLGRLGHRGILYVKDSHDIWEPYHHIVTNVQIHRTTAIYKASARPYFDK